MPRAAAVIALVSAVASVGASVAAAKREELRFHRSVKVTSAVEDEIGTAGAQSGQVTISAVDPTGYRDGLLIYLRRGQCFKTYKAANAYVTNDGYSNQITSGPPVPVRGSMTYEFSTQGDYYTVVCAMIYYSSGGQNPSGAPIGTTKPYVSDTYATGHAAIKHGPPVAVTTSANDRREHSGAERNQIRATGPKSVKLGANFTYMVTGDAVGPADFVDWLEFPGSSSCAPTFQSEGAVAPQNSVNEGQPVTPNRPFSFKMPSFYAKYSGRFTICVYLMHYERGQPNESTYAHTRVAYSTQS